MRLFNWFFICLTALIFVGIAEADAVKIVSPGSLQWRDVPNEPGLKMAVLMGDPDSSGPFAIRIKIPANYTVQPHTHPSNEMDTVISGLYYFGNGEQVDKNRAVALKPGTFVMIPEDTAHYGFAKQETIIQIGGRGPWKMEPVRK